MRDVEVRRVDTDAAQLGMPLEPPDEAAVLRGEFRLIDADSGRVLGGQGRVDRSLAVLRRQLPTVRYESLKADGRMSSIRYAHRTFGYLARQPIRQRDCCASAALAVDRRDVHDEVAAFTAELDELYRRLAPDAYARHARLVDEAILPEWRIDGGPWTSGIINQTAALPYHVDRNNLPGTWSAMLVVRRHLRGGWLHLPEWGVWASCEDQHAMIFEGSATLHGVTKFATRPGGYRYSLVWYCVDRMKHCLPFADEIARGSARRTERELDEAHRVLADADE